MAVRTTRRLAGQTQRLSVKGSDLFNEAARKVEESTKARGEISHRAQKESKAMRADPKGLAEAIVGYSKSLATTDPQAGETMRKVGDFQKWMEEFRNQMSNEAYNKIHIPFLEYAQEDIETLKAEKKKVDTEGTAEEPLQVVSTTLRKNELKSLQKLLEFVHVYHVYFKVGLKKLEDLKGPLEEQKKHLEEEVSKLESQRRSRKPTTSDAAPAIAKGAYFGLPLVEVLAKDKTAIPRVIQAAFQFLEKNSLATQGLFRIGAVQDDLKYMKEQINSGVDYTFEGQSEHTVSGLVKAFLRELPEPLFTYNLFSSFAKAHAIDETEERVAEVKKLVHQLPPPNFLLLRALITLCAKIARNQEVNKMTPNNISIVICPNVLYSKETSTMSMVEDISSSQNIFVTIIESYREIFESNLLEAALCGDTEVVQEILEKGDVNVMEVKDENGNTALHKAIDGAHLGVIRLLVEKNIELLNVPNAAGKAPLDYASELKGAFLSDVIMLLKETTEKFKSKWKKTLLNKTLSERKFSLSDVAPPSSAEIAAAEEEQESTDVRFAIVPFEDLVTEKQLPKTAFTLITLEEITDTIFSLTGASSSDPVDVSEIQKVIRNVLNVFKNLNASCKLYADLVTKEEEKKEILNTALQLQGKMRVLIAAVKGITSTPDDAAAKASFADACKQLTEGLQKFVSACEVVRVKATDNAVQELEQHSGAVVSAIRNYNVESFFKSVTPLANSTFKVINVGEARSFTVGDLESASKMFALKTEIKNTITHLINTGKNILKKPKTFLDRSGEVLVSSESTLQSLLQKLKAALKDNHLNPATPEEEKAVFTTDREYLTNLNQNDKTKELVEVPAAKVLQVLENLKEQDLSPSLSIKAANELSGALAQLSSVASPLVPSQTVVWQDSLAYSVVKLKLAACARCLDLKLEAIDGYAVAVTSAVALVGSFVNHLNTL